MKSVVQIWRAFGYSMEGIRIAIREERAFRQELLLCALLVPIALFLDRTPLEKGWLVSTLLIVLAVELLNSALETLANRVTVERDELVKRAKDLGSAAVFIALLNAGLSWLTILWGSRGS